MSTGNALAESEKKMASELDRFPGFRWWVLVLASLGFISMQLINLSVAPLVPVIATNLHDPGTATNVLMTSFLLLGC